MTRLQILLRDVNIPEERKTDFDWMRRNLLALDQSPEAIEAHKIVVETLNREKVVDPLHRIHKHKHVTSASFALSDARS